MITLWNVFLSFSIMLVPLSIYACISKKWVSVAPYKILKSNTFGLLAISLLAIGTNFLPSAIKPQHIVNTTDQVNGFSANSESMMPPTDIYLAPHTQEIINLIPFALSTFAAIFLFLHLYRLRLHIQKSFLYKRIGRVTIKLKENLQSPYVLSVLHRHTIVLPMWSLENTKHKMVFVSHELQHIRQGDTHMSYIIGILQWVYFWHPFFWLWKIQYEQIQEISCDCFLIGHKKINIREYTNCLLETHQKAWQNAYKPLGMTPAFWRHKKHLLWRVKFMSEYQKKNNKSSWRPLAMFTATLLVLVSTAYASKSLHQRTVDEALVTEIVDTLSIGQTKKKISVEVTKTLTEILNSPSKRQFYREALARLKDHNKIFDEEMHQYGVPQELKAMALVESGVQNLAPQNGVFERSTGVWQIIAPTARVLGLTVNSQVDERRDVVKATNAAIRYLVMNRARFNNWDLSVLSYNAGEKAVAAAIEKARSKDPMDVRMHLHPETQRYYINVIAAMIIMGNPNLVLEQK